MANKATAPDFSEHERTYRGFLRLGKWGTILVALALVALYFIVRP